VVPCEAVEDAALGGRASGRAGRGLEEARSFDIAVGDVGRVGNVGDEARAVYYGYGGKRMDLVADCERCQ
jgi:hypothetical protein